jgi:hypothetical protein
LLSLLAKTKETIMKSMNKYFSTGPLKELTDKACKGNPAEIDFIMKKLSIKSTLATTRFIDYALGLVENPEGLERIKFYLFHGTLIQRNYASLFFNRRGDWKYVKEAFEKGLIDEIQAYSR